MYMHLLSKKSLDGNLETLVLALLEKRTSYGYALNEQLHQLSGGSIQLKEGTLYPLLHRMEKHGWIEARWGEGIGKRQRKNYHLTSSGRELLKTRRAEWEQLKKVYQALVEAPGKSGAPKNKARKPSPTPPSKAPTPEPVTQPLTPLPNHLL